jgi:hypothetical protein
MQEYRRAWLMSGLLAHPLLASVTEPGVDALQVTGSREADKP